MKIVAISDNMKILVEGSSVIRKLFEEGMQLAEKIGSENVFDFSLGNPIAPCDPKIKSSIYDILENKDPNYVHGYMLNAGYPEVRKAIAESENRRFGTDFDADDIIMTVGAAGGLNIMMRTFLNPGDEVIVFAPFFGEYRSYASNFGGNIVVVPADTNGFQLNLDELEDKINEKTKVLIVNNPNNPSGTVYSAETLDRLQAILERCEERIGHPLYVISDEPYRELVYDGITVPYMTKHIKNCIVGYSFSKSLSVPGERIGYLAIPKQIDCYEEVRNAAITAIRSLGYVNAPSLFQLVVKECLDVKPDIEFYDKNRRYIYDNLTRLGFTCVKPQGAFYLFIKSPFDDESEFVAMAKKQGILVVPARTFGCAGYVRLAYCVSYDMLERSIPAFERLAKELGL